MNINTEPKQWNGKIHIISDTDFIKKLTDNEYQLYGGLKTISYHENGQHYLFFDQTNYAYLSEILELYAGKNKKGEDSIMSRQTISKTFKNLEEKYVIEKKEIEITDKMSGIKTTREVYCIITETDFKFTAINNELMKMLTKTLKGQVIKTYIYIKANFENNCKNNKNTYFNRETIANAIGEFNKKGDIGKRQLDNVTMYMQALFNFGLIDVCIENKINQDGTYSSRYKINNITDEVKKIPSKYVK